VNQPSTYENGQSAIVEFFGWPYDDITQECELNPWWFVYQPVSYRLHSRMGTKQQFKNMINTCRKNNVRVYADKVVNHMVGNGNGNGMYWDHRNPSGGSKRCNMRTTHSHQSALEWSSPLCRIFGWLTGLTDLNTEKDYVRQRIPYGSAIYGRKRRKNRRC
jgi:alpha-amylase